MKCDIAVIGAGAAGIAAAVAAAESDLKVVLIERYGFVGGLATAAMVGTLCGLYYRSMDRPRYAVQGFAREFAECVMAKSDTQPERFAEGLHFLPYQPAVFHQQAVQKLRQAGVQLVLHGFVSAVEVDQTKVTQLTLQTANAMVDLSPKVLIDCSGDAQISMLAGLGMIKQPQYQSAAFVFQLAGLPPMESRMLALNLIRWIKRGVHSGDLDPHCERLTIIPGTVKNGAGLFKLGLPEPFIANLISLTDYELEARSRCLDIVDYLRHAEPLLKSLTISMMATQVGIRSGPRPEGIQQLEAEPLLRCEKPADGVAIGAWPIEQWGKARKPTMRYFKSDDYYLIPVGSLVSRHLDNLFFAGRAFSASEAAIASARVIGTCLSTGYAAGMLAAGSVRDGAWQGAVKKIRAKQVFAAEV